MDEHLADQWIIAATLASQESQYRVAEVSRHLTTNAAVIEQFGLAQITVNEAEKIVSVKSLTR